MRKIAAGMLLSCIFGVPAHGDAMTARSFLRQALAASAGKDAGAAYEVVRKAIADPGFASLDTGGEPGGALTIIWSAGVVKASTSI
jgi:hypothetical protein